MLVTADVRRLEQLRGLVNSGMADRQTRKDLKRLLRRLGPHFIVTRQEWVEYLNLVKDIPKNLWPWRGYSVVFDAKGMRGGESPAPRLDQVREKREFDEIKINDIVHKIQHRLAYVEPGGGDYWGRETSREGGGPVQLTMTYRDPYDWWINSTVMAPNPETNFHGDLDFQVSQWVPSDTKNPRKYAMRFLQLLHAEKKRQEAFVAKEFPDYPHHMKKHFDYIEEIFAHPSVSKIPREIWQVAYNHDKKNRSFLIDTNYEGDLRISYDLRVQREDKRKLSQVEKDTILNVAQGRPVMSQRIATRYLP